MKNGMAERYNARKCTPRKWKKKKKKKLRLYGRFNSEYETDNYVKYMMPRNHRNAYAKVRCGAALIRIETGWYEYLAAKYRRCLKCTYRVEKVEHVLLHCPIYPDTGQNFIENIKANIVDLGQKSDTEKLCFILSNKVDHILRQSAKFCSGVFNIWRQFLSK